VSETLFFRNHRPRNDPEQVKAAQQRFAGDSRQRPAVEGNIGQGKRRFSLGLVCEKLAVIQGSATALSVLTMKLEKLIQSHFLFAT
jgi:hypothetical protein